MRTLFVTACFLFVAPALAQDGGVSDGGDDGGVTDAGDSDAGEPEVDAGPVDCTPRCEGDTLLFCEGEDELVELDCAAELDGVCGTLSDEWGADCLLPELAACDVGYADGVGRCQGGDEGEVCCVADVAGEPGTCRGQPSGTDCRDFVTPDAPRPRLSGVDRTDDELESCFGVNCANFPGLGLVPFLFALKLRRRRRS